LLLAAYRAFLAAEGVQTTTATNGPDCLAALCRGLPDVLIIDPELLGDAGAGILARLGQADLPPVPALILTTHPDEVARTPSPLPDSMLLLKPVPPAMLAGLIRILVESGSHLHTTSAPEYRVS
jgi:CheY-like chemotaxis protein